MDAKMEAAVVRGPLMFGRVRAKPGARFVRKSRCSPPQMLWEKWRLNEGTLMITALMPEEEKTGS